MYNPRMMQEEALQILRTGANVFLTGEPGSGKTHTINTYVAWLRDHGIEPAITASTGIAATHIGGMTLHSWSGIGVREYLTEYDVASIAENKNVKRRLTGADVLIIDEISMLSGSLLDMLDQILRAARERSTPFGGMQVVVVGDFFQLPPVVRRSYGGGDGVDVDEDQTSPFAFRSRAWYELNPIVCYLSEQHRQANDSFLELLQAVRRGEELEKVRDSLKSRVVKEAEAPKEAPRLFSHNRDVDRINSERLESISGKSHTYNMTGKGSDMAVASLKRGCLSPESLVLKKGARVMFTKNDIIGGQFANGTVGDVMEIAFDGTPRVRTIDGRTITVVPMEWTMGEAGRILARITQLPLRLAWAITVHKSQGMTLDQAVVDLSKAFEYGQGYVALSRVRALDGLHVVGYNERALEVHPEVAHQERNFKQQSADARARFSAMQPSEHDEIVGLFLNSAGGSLVGGVAPKKKKGRGSAPKEGTHETTLALIRSGKSISDIARARDIKEGTVIDHLQTLYVKDEVTKQQIERMISSQLRRALPRIAEAFQAYGTDKLSPVHAALKGVYSFDDLKLARILCG